MRALGLAVSPLLCLSVPIFPSPYSVPLRFSSSCYLCFQLQERYVILEKQYQQALEDGQAMQTKAKLGLQQLQKDLRDKNADIEELKLQVLTPEKEELLRQKIALDQEQPFAEKLYAVEMESEKFRYGRMNVYAIF